MAQLLLSISSAHTRLALRIYFNVILPLLALIGDRCCLKRSQLRLLRGQKLDISQTTGWLRTPAAVLAMYSMRRSPAGWLGFTMILAGLLWLASDLVVSALVVSTKVVDRCAFNTTGNYATLLTNHTVGPYTPGNVGTQWDQLTAAWSTSLANGGMTGIYSKVNSDLNFRASSEDILGQWNCTVTGNDVEYPARESQLFIANDLLERGLLYEYYTGEATTYIGINAYVQLLIWSSSVGDWDQNLTGTPEEIINSKELHLWDVRAVVDLQPNNTLPKIMRPFHCTMNASAVEFTMGKVQALSTLQIFTSNARGMIYGYFGDNVTLATQPDVALAMVLDQISMSASFSHTDHVAEDATQGCLTLRTKIPMSVILVSLITTGAFLGILGQYLYLSIVVRKFKHHRYSHAMDSAENVPNGLLGWMRQAIRETGQSSSSEYVAFKTWRLAHDAQYETLRLQPSGSDGIISQAHSAIASAPASVYSEASEMKPLTMTGISVSPLDLYPDFETKSSVSNTYQIPKRKPVSSQARLASSPSHSMYSPLN